MENRSATYFAEFQPRRQEEHRSGLSERFRVRPAEMRDVHGLARLNQEREGGVLEEHQERFLKELTEHPTWQHRLLLVAEDGEILIGFSRAAYFQPPPDAPPNSAPAGWYLAGLIVTPTYRRQGLGVELTRRRLDWIAERSNEVFYFVNAQNKASIALHTGFHFEEVTRDFAFPGAMFIGGIGILYRSELYSS